MAEADRLLAAAKVMFPQLWETPDSEVPMGHKVALTMARQRAMDKVVAGIEAYHMHVDTDELPAEEVVAGATPVEASKPEPQQEITPLGEFNVGLPSDAAMVQQVLVVITYIDNEGGTAHMIKTSGEGLRTTWLGMCVLAQDYLLNLPYRSKESGE